MITFTDWLNELAPHWHSRYLAWKAVGFDLEPGQWVETLTPGFSGYAGRQCQYIRTVGNTMEFGYIGEEPLWGVAVSEKFQRLVPIEAPYERGGVAQWKRT